MKTKLLFLLSVAVVCFGAVQPALAQTNTFQIEHQARNLTKQNFTWANSVTAAPGDRIEMRITVTWQGSASTTSEVFVRETLDTKLAYAGNLKIDGASNGGNITTQNITIGNLQADQSKAVTFEATVQSSQDFQAGQTNLVNTATVFNTQNANSKPLTVQVTRDGKPTDVSTGPLTVWMIGFGVMLFAGTLAGMYIFARQYMRSRVLQSDFENRIDRKLSATIGNIRKKEKKG